MQPAPTLRGIGCSGPRCLHPFWLLSDGQSDEREPHERARVAACAARADLARSCGGPLTVVWRSCDGWLTDQGAHGRARVAACAARADLARSCGGWLTVVWRSCDGWLTDQGAHERARVAACAARADLARSCGGWLTVVWAVAVVRRLAAIARIVASPSVFRRANCRTFLNCALRPSIRNPSNADGRGAHVARLPSRELSPSVARTVDHSFDVPDRPSDGNRRKTVRKRSNCLITLFILFCCEGKGREHDCSYPDGAKLCQANGTAVLTSGSAQPGLARLSPCAHSLCLADTVRACDQPLCPAIAHRPHRRPARTSWTRSRLVCAT